MKNLILTVFTCFLLINVAAQNISESGNWCEGNLMLTISDNSSSNIQWTKDGQILKGENSLSLAIQNYGEGEYFASYTSNDNSFALSYDVNIDGPIPSFTYVNYYAIGGIQLYGESLNDDSIVSWEWSIGDGEVYTEQNPIILFPSEDLYTMELTIIDKNGCQVTYTQTINWFYTD